MCIYLVTVSFAVSLKFNFCVSKLHLGVFFLLFCRKAKWIASESKAGLPRREKQVICTTALTAAAAAPEIDAKLM